MQSATSPGATPQLFGSQQDWMAAHGPGVIAEVGFDPASFGVAPIPVTGATSAGTSLAPLAPDQSLTQPRQVLALIDTGASTSCIDERLAQSLNLPLVNVVHVGGAGGAHQLNVYLCRLMIPQLNFARVGGFIGAKLLDGGQVHQALIGRDFLAQMILIYDGIKGRSTLAV